MDTDKKQTNAIKTIYERLQDSRNGYQECTEQVHDKNVQKTITELGQKRQAMMDAVRHTAGKLGYEAETSGSVAAVVHRAFVDLKSLLSRGDKEAIVREIERGEGLLIETYQKTLDTYSLPNELRELFTEQLAEIKQDLLRIAT